MNSKRSKSNNFLTTQIALQNFLTTQMPGAMLQFFYTKKITQKPIQNLSTIQTNSTNPTQTQLNQGEKERQRKGVMRVCASPKRKAVRPIHLSPNREDAGVSAPHKNTESGIK